MQKCFGTKTTTLECNIKNIVVLIPNEGHHAVDEDRESRFLDQHFIPWNATIREENIKCGKDSCNLCPHGPYFYVYWKDKSKVDIKSKLRKKYLGNIDPRR